jgi:hypothetical protein
MGKVRTKSGVSTGRIGVVIAVFLCHALAIWGLFSGGVVRVASNTSTPVQIIHIPERHKPLEPLPPRYLRLLAFQGLSNRALAAQIKAPLPQINIDVPTDAPVTTTTNPSSAASGEGAGVGAGLGAGHGSGAAISAPPKTDVQIILTQRLTPTGVQLAKDQTILITARGTMNFWTGSQCKGCTSTPDGMLCNGGGRFPVPRFPCWSLFGQIGPHGKPFAVGSYKRLIADSSGQLFLGVNDEYYPDNTGKWVATLAATDFPSPDFPEKRQVNKALGKLLTAASSAANYGNWDGALASTREAQSMKDKTPYEIFIINALLGRVFLQKRDLAAAAPALENAAASPYASAEQTGQWLRAAAMIEFQFKDYAKAVALGQQALQYYPSDTDVQSLIADSRRLEQPR